ncbi:MAG TPA: hypothetical protein VFU15_04800, partial [Bacteroidia bacterium]|nr:hypothetical protein [Bacteroidia bacterium]
RLVSQREFTGAIGAAAGMLFFLFWYTAIGILSWHFLPGHWMMPVSVVICPFAGLFAWIYHRTWHYIRRRWKTISMFYRNSEMISSLILKRKELIREFEAAAEEWRSARKG